MKLLRRTCLGLLLLLALSVPALAGDITNPPVAGTNGVIHNPAPGDISSPPTAAGDIPSPPGVAGDMSTPGAAGETQFPGIITALILALFS